MLEASEAHGADLLVHVCLESALRRAVREARRVICERFAGGGEARARVAEVPEGPRAVAQVQQNPAFSK